MQLHFVESFPKNLAGIIYLKHGLLNLSFTGWECAPTYSNCHKLVDLEPQLLSSGGRFLRLNFYASLKLLFGRKATEVFGHAKCL